MSCTAIRFVRFCLGIALIGGSSLWIQRAVIAQDEEIDKFEYIAGKLRDPFIPLVRNGRIVGATLGRTNTSPVPVLMGVLWDPSGRSIALLDTGEVRVGDEIGNYTVKLIKQDSVVLVSGEDEVVLQVVNESTTGGVPQGSPRGGDGL